jgi:hypothetical protein
VVGDVRNAFVRHPCARAGLLGQNFDLRYPRADSAFNRHPNPARDCAESVNWNLKGAQKRQQRFEFEYEEVA